MSSSINNAAKVAEFLLKSMQLNYSLQIHLLGPLVGNLLFIVITEKF